MSELFNFIAKQLALIVVILHNLASAIQLLQGSGIASYLEQNRIKQNLSLGYYSNCTVNTCRQLSWLSQLQLAIQTAQRKTSKTQHPFVPSKQENLMPIFSVLRKWHLKLAKHFENLKQPLLKALVHKLSRLVLRLFFGKIQKDESQKIAFL